MYSKSTDGGATWTAPARVFAPATRTPIGYPVTQPSGGTLNAPDPAGPVEDVFPAVAVAPERPRLLRAYRGDVVSPWQTCADCARRRPRADQLRHARRLHPQHAARLRRPRPDDSVTTVVSTHPINTRNGFGGGFFGDYTDIAVGSDNAFHAFWTDSNNKQTVVWFYGFEFVPTPINQEDVAVCERHLLGLSMDRAGPAHRARGRLQ